MGLRMSRVERDKALELEAIALGEDLGDGLTRSRSVGAEGGEARVESTWMRAKPKSAPNRLSVSDVCR